MSDSSERTTAFTWEWNGGNFHQDTRHGEGTLRDLPFLVIVCPESGTYRIRFPETGEVFEGRPGDVLIAPARVPHTVACPEGCRLHFLHLGFTLDGWIDPLEKRRFPNRLTGEEATALFALTERLAEEYLSSDAAARQHALFTAVRILEELLDCSEPTPVPRQNPTHSDAVNKAIRYMKKHFREPIRRSKLAAIAGFSETRFHTVFHEITGQPPMKYLASLRIQEAKKELIRTGDSLKIIAEKCGFADVCYFNRQFRAMTGATPGVFRKKQRENP